MKAVSLVGSKQCAGGLSKAEEANLLCYRHLLYVKSIRCLILLWVEYSSALYHRNCDKSLVLVTDDIHVVTSELGMSSLFPAITRCVSILTGSL